MILQIKSVINKLIVKHVKFFYKNTIKVNNNYNIQRFVKTLLRKSHFLYFFKIHFRLYGFYFRSYSYIFIVFNYKNDVFFVNTYKS